MPQDRPTAAQLWSGEISFFSLDTDLIQSAGYSFDAGVLNQLPQVFPKTMQLLLTEVTAREIVSHLMKSVTQAMGEFRKGSDTLKRSVGIDMDQIDKLFEALSVVSSAEAVFRERVDSYAERCRGEVLPIGGGDMMPRIFERYFAGLPPFGARKDKKAEFPDAMSLLLLEDYARDHGTRGVVASRDEGWSEFAGKSEYLYCVKSLDALIALFEATGEHAKTLADRIASAVEDENSFVRAALLDGFRTHIHESSWNVENVYSGVVPRVEAATCEADVISHVLQSDRTKVWNLEEDKSVWVVELTASLTVEVQIDVTFYVWDAIDREEMELDTQTVRRKTNIEVKAFLTVGGAETEVDPAKWDVGVEIAPGQYEIDVGEVEPEYSGD
ncbi:hypothetical protein DR64_3971 [Paraburkholderia xenovorans LB400]|uniref:DUF4935 domain-containing protein n=1 Tax=Paraburkholderia xenovorans (strain LB400) TaxID=266265 RepID=Q13XN8_PARXL|nr:PIN domain-containing protein [Paraburkholderia xenovorans]ABE31151.1 hypothetical protein Bxe_A1808 [Paraburkholderia xenovorans LB400]AIP29983.1 hypothetical protein DR64_3971 [Paraburkholderia xenovorans LB400]